MIKLDEVSPILSDADKNDADSLETEIDAAIKGADKECARGHYSYHTHRPKYMAQHVMAEVCHRYMDAGWNVIVMEDVCNSGGVDILLRHPRTVVRRRRRPETVKKRGGPLIRRPTR
jgi:hypothetical protein